MPLGKDEAVAVGPVGVLGVMPQEPAEIEGRHDLGRRQRTAGMTRAGLGRHLQDVLADRLGAVQQGVQVIGHRHILLAGKIPGSSTEHRLRSASVAQACPVSSSRNVHIRLDFACTSSFKLNDFGSNGARGSSPLSCISRVLRRPSPLRSRPVRLEQPRPSRY